MGPVDFTVPLSVQPSRSRPGWGIVWWPNGGYSTYCPECESPTSPCPACQGFDADMRDDARD